MYSVNKSTSIEDRMINSVVVSYVTFICCGSGFTVRFVVGGIGDEDIWSSIFVCVVGGDNMKISVVIIRFVREKSGLMYWLGM